MMMVMVEIIVHILINNMIMHVKSMCPLYVRLNVCVCVCARVGGVRVGVWCVVRMCAGVCVCACVCGVRAARTCGQIHNTRGHIMRFSHSDHR